MLKIMGITGAAVTDQNPRGLIIGFDNAPYILAEAALLVEGYIEDRALITPASVVKVKLLTRDALTGNTVALFSFEVAMEHLVDMPTLLGEEYDPTIANDEQFDEFEASCCENERRNMNGGCDNCGDPCL